MQQTRFNPSCSSISLLSKWISENPPENQPAARISCTGWWPAVAAWLLRRFSSARKASSTWPWFSTPRTTWGGGGALGMAGIRTPAKRTNDLLLGEWKTMGAPNKAKNISKRELILGNPKQMGAVQDGFNYPQTLSPSKPHRDLMRYTATISPVFAGYHEATRRRRCFFLRVPP